MPDRFPGRKLATLYAQPLEIGCGLMILFVGVVISFDHAASPASISELQWPWTILFRILMIVGGGLVLLGAIPRRRWSKGVEILGAVCMATVFSTYAGGLYDDGNSRSFMAGATNAVVAVAWAIKAYALWLESQQKLNDIRRIPVKKVDGE